jgi:hypothetical protein
VLVLAHPMLLEMLKMLEMDFQESSKPQDNDEAVARGGGTLVSELKCIDITDGF